MAPSPWHGGIHPSKPTWNWGTPSPTQSAAPSSMPSPSPTGVPSPSPSDAPSAWPSSTPSCAPSSYPSSAPSRYPSAHPSSTPSRFPSSAPSRFPSAVSLFGHSNRNCDVRSGFDLNSCVLYCIFFYLFTFIICSIPPCFRLRDNSHPALCHRAIQVEVRHLLLRGCQRMALLLLQQFLISPRRRAAQAISLRYRTCQQQGEV